METLLASLTAVAGSLLKVSAQASLLIGLVLLAQWLLRRHLSPRVCYALWLLVVARLLLPVSVESGLSVFNFTTATPAEVFRAVGAAAKPSAVTVEVNNAPAPVASTSPVPAPMPPGSAGVSPAPGGGRADGTPALLTTAPASGQQFPWALAFTLVWLAGVAFLLARIIVIPLRLNARLARHETPTAPGVFAILEESKRLSGVNRVLPIVQSRAVQSPALLGFIRPWLLLPEGLVERFTPQELRLVFLHELAHLKRRDIAVNWLATLLQILHWPNPLVWLAFARMRADRELACDELALSFARAGESGTYGHAIIKLLEGSPASGGAEGDQGFRRPAALPGLVGILEDQTQMKRRIAMIAQFKTMTRWSAAGVAVVFTLGLVTLTDAQSEKLVSPARIFGADGPKIRTLLSGTSEEVYGVLSPDESAVVYINWNKPQGSGGDLMLRDLSTGVTKTLVAAVATEKIGFEFPGTPVWSADSKLIAYGWTTWEDEALQNSIREISREGGSPRIIQVEPAESSGELQDWSKDGKRLLVRFQKQHSLATLEVATGVLHVIGPEGVHARFSPNGRAVVCERLAAGNRAVYVLSSDGDGSQTERVTASAVDEGGPVFSADGKLVLFSSRQRGSWDLWAVKFVNGRTVGDAFPVRYDFGDHTKWLMATGNIAYTASSSGVDGRVSTDAYEIVATQSPSATEARPKAIAKASGGRNFIPIWSPDGKKIAYARWRGVSGEWPALVVQSVADGIEQVYGTEMTRLDGIAWSQDGQTIAVNGLGEAGRGWYPFSLASQRWDSAHAGAKTLNELGFPAAASPANAVQIVKGADEQQLVISDPVSGKKRVIARVRTPAVFRKPMMSPEGSKLAYVISPELSTIPTTKVQLHIAAADASWDRVVETGTKYFGGWGPGTTVSWSSDSSSILVTLSEDLSGEIGVLENFLPKEAVATK